MLAKAMAEMLARLNIDSSALILLPEANANVERSARNLGSVKTLRANCLSVRDLLGYDYIVIPREAVEMIHAQLGEAA